MLSVKPIPRGQVSDYKYSVTITRFDEIRDEISRCNFIREISEICIANISAGIAVYNIINGDGYASDNWYNNMCEEPSSNIFVPSYSLLKQNDKIKITNFIKECKNKADNRLEIELNIIDKKSGKAKWIKEIIYVNEFNPEKGIVRLIDFTYDITLEKNTKQQLIKRRDTVKSALIDTENFINNLNHALRIPLTSILGFANTLLGIEDNKEREEIIKIIKKNNEQLIEVINNVMLICKLESNKYKFSISRVSLNEILKELKTATEFMISSDKPKSNINVKLDLPEIDYFIETDEYNFKYVMINFIANAVKYTKKGTIVLGYNHNDNGYYFYVKDT